VNDLVLLSFQLPSDILGCLDPHVIAHPDLPSYREWAVPVRWDGHLKWKGDRYFRLIHAKDSPVLVYVTLDVLHEMVREGEQAKTWLRRLQGEPEPVVVSPQVEVSPPAIPEYVQTCIHCLGELPRGQFVAHQACRERDDARRAHSDAVIEDAHRREWERNHPDD
jgi:hypothetical protein